ncbi:MAG: MoaD/ThiS family protein [Kineosporiaceae bacterium]
MTVRLFAGARAAAGGTVAEEVAPPAGSTVGDALDLVVERHPGLRPVLPACSFLLDGVRAGAASALGRDGDERTLDVLPPFSGG